MSLEIPGITVGDAGMILAMVGDERPDSPAGDVYPQLPRSETPDVVAARRSMKSAVLRSSAILAVSALLVAAGVPYYGVMFYDFYWSRRDCFNAAGYCDYRDAGGESHRVFAQTGIFFGALAAACAIGAAALTLAAWWSWRRFTSKMNVAESGS